MPFLSKETGTIRRYPKYINQLGTHSNMGQEVVRQMCRAVKYKSRFNDSIETAFYKE